MPAITEKHSACLRKQLDKKNRVKRADKRRIDELRVEIGMKERFKKKLSRSIFAMVRPYAERMGDGTLAKSADAQRVGGGEGGEEEQNCDGTTALIESWKE